MSKGSPIYKSGDKEGCENCRPISVLSVFAKVFKKLVVGQLSHNFADKILTRYPAGV